MASSEELLERSIEIQEKYSSDPRTKYGDYWDLLHGGMGEFEYSCLEGVFHRLREQFV